MISRVPILWRRIDIHLLRSAPNLWLMKIHWLATSSVISCSVLAIIGALRPISITNHPDIANEQDALFALAVISTLWWSVRYVSRVTPLHVGAQRAAHRLFLLHLLCVFFIFLPIHIMPTVLFWRFDNIVDLAPDIQDRMLAHQHACRKINKYWYRHEIDHAPDPPQISLGVTLCSAWESNISWYSPHDDHQDDPKYDAQEALIAVNDLLAVHRHYGIKEDDQTFPFIERRAVAWTVAEQESKDSRSHGQRNSWIRSTWYESSPLPAYLLQTKNLVNSWCYLAGERTGFCELPSINSPDHPREGTLRQADLIASTPQIRAYVILTGLVSCFVSLLLTAARMGTLRRVLGVAVLVVGADAFFPFLLERFGVERHEYSLLVTQFAAIAFVASTILVISLRVIISRNIALQRTPVDILVSGSCLLAPLMPLFWLKPPGSVSGFFGAIAYSVYPFSEHDYNQRYVGFTGDYGGVPLHWCIACLAVLMSIFSAFTAMDTWFQIRLRPRR